MGRMASLFDLMDYFRSCWNCFVSFWSPVLARNRGLVNLGPEVAGLMF